MNAAALIFMLVVMGGVFVLAVFCFYKMFKAGNQQK